MGELWISEHFLKKNLGVGGEHLSYPRNKGNLKNPAHGPARQFCL